MRLRLAFLPILLVLASWVNAAGQSETDTYAVHPNLKVSVRSLPSFVSASKSDSAVITASLATLFMDPRICCGRNSGLEDQVGSIDVLSLREVGTRVRGKHYMSDGSSFVVTDHYWTASSVTPEVIIGSLSAQRPLLMTWDGHLFVLYGVVFDEYKYDSGLTTHSIRKLLLVDTRYSDDQRYLSFDRQSDDWGKVGGLLALTVTR